MRRFSLSEFVKRANFPIRGDRDPYPLTCGCGVSGADVFGNRDLEPDPDCPLHGGNS
jgi:hypothetical protein